MNITKIENNMNQNFCGFKVNKYAISQLREDSLNELFRMKKVFANSRYIDVDIKQRPSWKSPDPVVSFRIKKLPKNVECDGRFNCDISEISVYRDSVKLNRNISLLGLEAERPNKCGEYKLTPGFCFWETLDRIEALEQAFQKKEASNKVLNKFANAKSKECSDIPLYINSSFTKIKKIIGREILDSRGNPAVEAEVFLDNGISARGVAPSGASTGIFEALELRDGDKSRYNGKGVLHAVNNINSRISRILLGQNVTDIHTVDNKMISLDGTQNKTNLGANAMLAVSIACARAASKFLEIPLYKFIGGSDVKTLPVPMMNILNGGAHVANSLDNQDFMIVPVGAKTFKEGLRWCSEVYYSLKNLLKKEGYATSVGDVGGFAPNLKNEEEALEHLVRAIKNAGYKPYDDFVLAIDAASSQWKHPTKGVGYYLQPKSGNEFTSDELIAHYEYLADRFPLASIEDGLDEEDWVGWQKMTERLGKKVQLVGDDLFVTNTKRLKKGIENNCANSILIKPNQIGTISETLEATEMAQKSSYSTIISNRSGETADTTIADLAVATNSGQIKTGAPSRSERVEKYNQLLRIEEQLGDKAQYLGRDVFSTNR